MSKTHDFARRKYGFRSVNPEGNLPKMHVCAHLCTRAHACTRDAGTTETQFFEKMNYTRQRLHREIFRKKQQKNSCFLPYFFVFFSYDTIDRHRHAKFIFYLFQNVIISYDNCRIYTCNTCAQLCAHIDFSMFFH